MENLSIEEVRHMLRTTTDMWKTGGFIRVYDNELAQLTPDAPAPREQRVAYYVNGHHAPDESPVVGDVVTATLRESPELIHETYLVEDEGWRLISVFDRDSLEAEREMEQLTINFVNHFMNRTSGLHVVTKMLFHRYGQVGYEALRQQIIRLMWDNAV